MKRTLMAVLLLSGIYTDVALWACKHAVAETRVIVRPVCVSPGSCEYWELGFLDSRGQFRFMQRMQEDELRIWLRQKIIDGTLQLKE